MKTKSHSFSKCFVYCNLVQLQRKSERKKSNFSETSSSLWSFLEKILLSIFAFFPLRNTQTRGQLFNANFRQHDRAESIQMDYSGKPYYEAVWRADSRGGSAFRLGLCTWFWKLSSEPEKLDFVFTFHDLKRERECVSLKTLKRKNWNGVEVFSKSTLPKCYSPYRSQRVTFLLKMTISV